ncbi:hypothetical protein HDU67_003072 [Dinochytrium kinnereticum]|nr:hypothetical protein HDU67_003072 [Dinochytrium kinnereticum]
MQVTRSTSYIFWPLLFASQAFDKILPRYLALRYEIKQMAVVEPIKDARVDDGGEDGLPLPPRHAAEREDGDVKTEEVECSQSLRRLDTVIEPLSNSNTTVTSIVADPVPWNPDILPKATPTIHSVATKPNSQSINPTRHATLAIRVNVIDRLQSVEKEMRSRMPYQYMRRDHCFADYLALMIGLGLVLVSPEDFLARPNELRGEDGEAKKLGFFEHGDGNAVIESVKWSDTVFALGVNRQWRTIVLAAVGSFVFSAVLEWGVVLWENWMGVPMYDPSFAKNRRLQVVVILAVTFVQLWIMAGARGLFSYGPLDAGYES